MVRLAATIATLAVALALLAAPPAHADTAPVDNYLRQLHQLPAAYAPVGSDDDLVGLGRAVCADVMGSHIPVVQVSTEIMQGKGWTRYQANALIGRAVGNLCPSPGVFY